MYKNTQHRLMQSRSPAKSERFFLSAGNLLYVRSSLNCFGYQDHSATFFNSPELFALLVAYFYGSFNDRVKILNNKLTSMIFIIF